jgi:pimeloyl-ACP methyl ester carboxylesterase
MSGLLSGSVSDAVGLVDDWSQTKISVQGVTLNVIQAGPRNAPAVLFLHGFPDTWRVWRKQIPEFTRRGYRVIVPDLMGYGDSDKPSHGELYRIDPWVAQQMLVLLDHLHVPSVHLVGHDWGAVLAWTISARFPDRVKTLSVLTVGHPAVFHRLHASLSDYGRGWYHFWFQVPILSPLSLRPGDFWLLRQIAHGGGDQDQWRMQFSKPGALTSALKWFRANSLRILRKKNELPPVDVPTLGIQSDGDFKFVNRAEMLESKHFVRRTFRYEFVRNASHWPQLDQPKVVNEKILELIASNR